MSDSDWQARLDLNAQGLVAFPLVAEQGGRAMGLAWGVIHAPEVETAHIYQMWVAPTARGKGIAKSLLGKIKTWAIDKECDCLALDVTTSNEAAVCLYRSSGFMATGQPVQGSCRLFGFTLASSRGRFEYCNATLFPRVQSGCWEIHMAESGDDAATLLQRSVLSEKCLRTSILLYSGNQMSFV